MIGTIRNGQRIVTVGEISLAIESLTKMKKIIRDIDATSMALLYEFDTDLFAKINALKAIVTVDDGNIIDQTR